MTPDPATLRPSDLPTRVLAIITKPAAFLPIAMSLAALAVLGITLARFGIVRQADEGTAAHIWQLLMVAQLPIIAFFAIQWVPRTPKLAFLVLGLQIVAMLAAMAPVYLLGL